MPRMMRAYQHWFGEWSGRGTTKKNVPVNIHVVIRPRLAGEVIEFSVESLHEMTSRLVHGVVALVSADPDGQIRMAASSTIHGAIVLQTTPDDPGALAFAGRSVMNHRVVVSFVEDGPDLLLTAHWKPDTPGEVEPAGMTNCRLSRVAVEEE